MSNIFLIQILYVISIPFSFNIKTNHETIGFSEQQEDISLRLTQENIKEKDINQSFLFHYLLAVLLEKDEINITNQTDPFFTDICFHYSTINNTDATLSERQTSYYIDPSVYCDEGCLFLRFDFSLKKALCNCSKTATVRRDSSSSPWPTTSQSSDFNFFDMFLISNIEIVSCYKNVFNLEMLSFNLGFWILFILTMIELLNCFLFAKIGFNSLLAYLSKMNNQKIKIDNSVFNNNQIKIIPFEKETPQSSNRNLLCNQNKKNCAQSSQIALPENNNPDPQCENISINQKPLNILKEGLNNLEYSKALILDKRTFIQHYRAMLVLYQPILSTFFVINLKKIRSIKISIFFFSIIMQFCFNALFYNNKYISNFHQLQGEFDFFYHLPKAIVAYLCASIIIFISKIFSFYDSGIRDIQNNTNTKNEQLMIKRFVSLYKIKLFLYFFIQFMLVFFSWYYVTAFCSVFKNNQMPLFTSTRISFALYLIIPFITSFFVACMRYCSIRYKNECLYKYSAVLI